MIQPGQVFISYKREDEPRVARLVQALEQKGFALWWDRNLPHDEAWRGHIQRALEASGCAVVVWTEASVAAPPESSFVVEEASVAKQRGILVAVRLDRVRAPLGFQESAQPVDLMDWKGRLDDPFFVDLCDAILAKLEGRSAPVPKGHRSRWRRRLTLSGITGVLMTSGVAFTVPVVVPPELVCTVNALQPGLSDLCGALGIGRRPSRAERLAWETRESGSCPALRQHVQRFPDGYYRGQAAEFLTARRVTQFEHWAPRTHELDLFVGGEGSVKPSEHDALAAAEARAQRQAERLCRGFAATPLFRLVSARAEVQKWQCDRTDSGVGCSGEGRAICWLEERRAEEAERCGGE